MEFTTSAHETIYRTVQGFMKELFGESAQAREDIPGFGLRMGSAWVQTFVDAWGDDDAVVTVRAWVVNGAEPTVDLLRYLLEANDNVRFGAFGLGSDSSIFFQHALVGGGITKEQLRASIMAVSFTADDSDEKIVARFGGTRASDPSPTPPTPAVPPTPGPETTPTPPEPPTTPAS